MPAAPTFTLQVVATENVARYLQAPEKLQIVPMGTKLPRVKTTEVVRLLWKRGFEA